MSNYNRQFQQPNRNNNRQQHNNEHRQYPPSYGVPQQNYTNFMFDPQYHPNMRPYQSPTQFNPHQMPPWNYYHWNQMNQFPSPQNYNTIQHNSPRKKDE